MDFACSISFVIQVYQHYGFDFNDMQLSVPFICFFYVMVHVRICEKIDQFANYNLLYFEKKYLRLDIFSNDLGRP